MRSRSDVPSGVLGDDGRWRRFLRLTESLTLELVTSDPGWEDALDPRYREFWARGGAAGTVRLRLRSSAAPPATPDLLEDLSRYPVTSTVEDGVLRLEHPRFRVLVDRRLDRGLLTAPRHRFPVDAVVRHLLAMEPGGVLLHGTLLVEDGEGWMGVGPSGSGKSTLAELLPQRALCDELVLAIRTDVGWEALATPFWHGTPGRAPLRAIHLLEHGEETRSRRLAPGLAWRGLASQVVWPDWRDRAQARVFHRLGDLVREVPVFGLEFRPEPEVWSTIRGAA